MKSKNPIHQVWRTMIARCHNPKVKCYPRYGGRGISVCERWRNSYDLFIADMGPRPSGMMIERKDNGGNYEPGNCRWATATEQNRNTRRTWFITFRGERKPAVQWAEELGIPYARLRSRRWSGWTDERILGPKKRFSKITQFQAAAIRRLYASGEQTQSDLARACGLCPSAISRIVTGHNWKQTIT